MDVINNILNECEKAETEAKKSTQVVKLIPPEVYPGDLLVCDTNELNLVKLRGTEKENELLKIARDCTQVLFNKLSEFPKEVVDGYTFLKVTGSEFPLPREKPLPIPKPLTKWQQFAKEKGIKQTKKAKSTWDDVLQKWIPTYGYRKAAAEKDKNWLIEVPPNVDPNTDMFAEKTKTKKENIAKNEFQRLRNIAAARKVKVPKMGVPPMEGNLHVPQLETAAEVARLATASLGKFEPGKPTKKKQLIDVSKGVNKFMHEEQTTSQSSKKEGKNAKSRKGKKGKGKGSKKNRNSFHSKQSGSSKGGKKNRGNGRKRR